MTNLCIIPARGGSKRIPRKNIKLFLGKPIIAYSIEAAISSGLFEEVMVSTDDSEIAEVAKKYGAIVPFLRSDKTSNDFATTFDVIEEVLENYKKIDKCFTVVCCLYACAPFVTSQKLSESLEILDSNSYDSVFPVIPFGFPIQRSLKFEGNKINFFYPEFSLSRSQDLEKSYHDAGQFYWMKIDKCLKQKKILTENTGSIIISEMEGQDIDNEVDWKLAELKYELLQNIT
ncbi:pseudaminic acid cytidylyltransferase [Flavobacterium sp. LC2016-23]|uniref:pseudaminic acid cytidylyltransferase n=1 Tax=Flavobacterium sp. LC2016-23 TaxID=2666330 RepID=UPI0012B002B1|nr:pseudaminic acid cytidylyltransferase [Flavobacterium sp. LC2016-23]MRX38757.1 pseudaminic acid cytidylyltransferase [Flavobacterium sp. LC2016-23]